MTAFWAHPGSSGHRMCCCCCYCWLSGSARPTCAAFPLAAPCVAPPPAGAAAQVTHMGLAAIQDAVLQHTDLLLVDGGASINSNNTHLSFLMQVSWSPSGPAEARPHGGHAWLAAAAARTSPLSSPGSSCNLGTYLCSSLTAELLEHVCARRPRGGGARRHPAAQRAPSCAAHLRRPHPHPPTRPTTHPGSPPTPPLLAHALRHARMHDLMHRQVGPYDLRDGLLRVRDYYHSVLEDSIDQVRDMHIALMVVSGLVTIIFTVYMVGWGARVGWGGSCISRD
jgi:hypothetical protein